MNKILIFFLFLGLSQVAQAAAVISVSNNMMISTGSQDGTIGLGSFDPFNPALNCNTFSAPNSCISNGREPIKISLSFNYSVVLDALSGTSVDLAFTVNNGSGGTGEVINIDPPENLYSLHDGSLGSFDLGFEIPIFGPLSAYDYGVDLIIDVTINP